MENTKTGQDRASDRTKEAWSAYYRAIYGGADSEGERRKLLRLACNEGISHACDLLAESR